MSPFFIDTMRTWSDGLLLGLIMFAVRATLLLGAAWGVTRLLRGWSAASRHLIWTGAIAGVLLLPVLSMTAPSWDVPMLDPQQSVEISAPAAIERGPSEATPPTIAVSETRQEPSAAANVATAVPERETSVNRARAFAVGIRDAMNAKTIAATLWLALAVLLLVRLAVANARVSAWQRAARGVEDGSKLALLHKLSRQYGIERPVVLLESPDTDVPVTWGIVYPVILLPTELDWDDEQRVAVLTHELAHVKRFDALTQQLAQIALALLWFHPLVWVAVRRMRLEREHACDDFVLSAGARASRYADDLLSFARGLTRPTAPAPAALSMARRSELEGRLLAILDPSANRSNVRKARVALLSALVIVVAAPLAAFKPVERVVARAASVASHPVVHSDAPRAEPMQATPPAPRVASDKPAAEAPAPAFEQLTARIGMISAPTMQMLAPQIARLRADTEPKVQIDVQTLIDVTRAAKRMSSDMEKGQLLALIAKRYIRNDALRDAYIDATSTFSSDMERGKALIALLDHDSLPASSIAQVLRSTASMSSDMEKSGVLKKISLTAFSDTAVQHAYIDILRVMSSDMERAAALSALIKQKLSRSHQLAVLSAIAPMTGDLDKATVLVLFVDKQGLADEGVKKAFFKTAETLTSDMEYRRVMTAVMR